MINRLREQMNDRLAEITQLKSEIEIAQGDLGRLGKEEDARKDELKEVMTALEDLALQYDQKNQEVEAKAKEIDLQSDELAHIRVRHFYRSFTVTFSRLAILVMTQIFVF